MMPGDALILGDEAAMAGAGFFGKVTSHGDFVSRRLPGAFVQPWDAWLQSALLASRRELAAGWLATYLNSPLWRFLLAPGVCGAQAWAGVLMPSVDRVGRHFPLTVAAPLGAVPFLDWVAQSAAWYEDLEDLALSSLQPAFALEAFDAQLLAVALPASVAGAEDRAPAPGWVTPMADLGQLPSLLPALGARLANAGLAGQSLWWTDGSLHVTPGLLQCAGLPSPAGFAALLEGRWAAHGWQVG